MKYTFKNIAFLLIFALFIASLPVITALQSEKTTQLVEAEIDKPIQDDDIATFLEWFDIVVNLAVVGETVEQFNEKAKEYDRITEVQVFADITSRHEDNRVYKGVLEDGMLIVVFFDEKSEIEYFLGPVPEYPNNDEFKPTRSSNGFVLPVDNIVLTSQLSGNISNYYGNGHSGLDIAYGGTHYPSSMGGTPIRAVRGGTIVGRVISNVGYGNYLVVRHDSNVTTLYAHMNSISAKQTGSAVSQGEVIGTVGSTGDSTGPHLHFEVILGNTSANNWSLTRTNPLTTTYLIGAPTYNPTYTINFNENGGTIIINQITATYNSSTLTGPWFTPLRSGHFFNGYFTAPTGGIKVIDRHGDLHADAEGYTDADRKWIRTSGATLYAQWTPFITTGTYYIQNQGGRYLHIQNNNPNNGARPVLWSGFGGTNTKYYFEYVGTGGNGEYRIKTALSNRFLEVRSASTADGAEVAIWDWGDQSHKYWYIEKHGDHYIFVNKNSGKVIDIKNGYNHDGAETQQYKNNNPPRQAQRFNLIPA